MRVLLSCASFLTAERTISDLTDAATSSTHDTTSFKMTLDAKFEFEFLVKREKKVLCLMLHFSVIFAPFLDISIV
jgi:hypothetical protein